MRVRYRALHPAEQSAEHAGRLVEARCHPNEAVLAQQVPHRAAQVHLACATRARCNTNTNTDTSTDADAEPGVRVGARAGRKGDGR